MYKHYITIIFLCFSTSVFCQTKAINEMKNKQKNTLKKIEMTGKMLDETKKSTTTSLNRLKMLNEQISMRQSLINQINNEIQLIDNEIKKMHEEIELQQKKLASLKEEYAQLMYHTYLRKDSHDKLMFILSANNFSQSYRRLRYLQEFSNYRKEQGKQIEQLTIELNEKLSAMEMAKNEKKLVLQRRENENNNLKNEENKQKNLVSELKKKENVLLKELKQQQKQINDLNNKIANLIAEEERKARERAEKERLAREKAAREKAISEGKKPKQASTEKQEYKLTKEEQLISGNFEKNKGRLPWPVSKGIIVGKFGIQQHPVLTYVTTNNKGIYIQTKEGEDARVVFEGEVTQRFSIPGNNNAVIIKHGNYRTVYSNLTEIYVKEGDKVKGKQKIGKIYTDSEENKTELYFMVWKEKELQNPELFLAK